MNFDEYRPNQEVLSQLGQLHVVGVVAPTAVGKSTVIQRVQDQDDTVRLVASTTSRPARPGEAEGASMHFRTKKVMAARAQSGGYVNVVFNFDNFYATAPEDYAVHGTSVFPPIAATVPYFRSLPFASFRAIALLPPSYEVWRQRRQQRGIDAEQLRLRLVEAEASFRFAAQDPEAIIIVNDDLDVAAQTFLDVIQGGMLDAQQQLACRVLARELLQQLQAETKHR